MDLFDCTDAFSISHYLRLKRLMLLQTLHLVLNVSDVLEALLFRNRQLVFYPALGLTVQQIYTIRATDYVKYYYYYHHYYYHLPLLPPLLLLPFYGHYTGQPALARNPVKNWKILQQQSFTNHMPLPMEASALAIGRKCYSSLQWWYLYRLHHYMK